MGEDTIKYLTCNSDAFRVTMIDNKSESDQLYTSPIPNEKYYLQEIDDMWPERQ